MRSSIVSLICDLITVNDKDNTRVEGYYDDILVQISSEQNPNCFINAILQLDTRSSIVMRICNFFIIITMSCLAQICILCDILLFLYKSSNQSAKPPLRDHLPSRFAQYLTAY